MPSCSVIRGKRRVKGIVYHNRKAIKQRTWPDDSSKSFKEAAIWEKEVLKQYLKTLAADEVSTNWTLFDWAAAYMKFSRKTHSKQVSDAKKAALKRFLGYLGDVNAPVETVNAEAVLGFMLDQEDSGRPGGGINNDKKDLGAAWAYGVKYLAKFPKDQANPFHTVPDRSFKQQARYVPPETDFWKVFDTSAGQDRVMLITYLCTAARRSEIFNLKVPDLDFENHQIQLWTRKRRGGNLESDWIPMVPMLEQALRSWLECRPLDTETVFVCLDQTPFVGGKTGKGEKEDLYGKPFKERRWWMKRLCQRAKVKEFGLHGIRHLSASILYEKGTDLAVIQQILRHQNPNTTARYLRKLKLTIKARNAMATAYAREIPPQPTTPPTGGKVVSIFDKMRKPHQDVAAS